jgi:hypothetical protein
VEEEASKAEEEVDFNQDLPEAEEEASVAEEEDFNKDLPDKDIKAVE